MQSMQSRQMYKLQKLDEYPNTILIKNVLDPMSSDDWLATMTDYKNKIDDDEA